MSGHRSWQRRLAGLFLGASLALLPAGCLDPAGAPPSGITELAADAALGPALGAPGDLWLSFQSNGISQNGISQNGISQNGLSQNGLDMDGLSTPAFTTWFDAQPALADLVMRYVSRCAAAAGSTVAWTHPVTNVAYSWPGGLGLATEWAAGSPATVAEQQVVSACLAAMTNKFGVSVSIAVEGRTAAGVQLAVEADELGTFSTREACFFGNLFAGPGVFSGIDHALWSNTQSSTRACAFDQTRWGSVSECPPIVFVGACSDHCVPDASGLFYETCTLGDVAYRPLATRIRPSDVFRCGDGVCQISERCGTRSESWQCKDCGPCP